MLLMLIIELKFVWNGANLITCSEALRSCMPSREDVVGCQNVTLAKCKASNQTVYENENTMKELTY